MNIKTILSNKKLLIKISIIAASIVILVAAVHLFSHFGTSRRFFTYPVSGSQELQTEVRYLNSKPVQGKIQYYVDELILGPSFYRGRALFTPGTHVEYCFLRDESLYVGLSQEAALQQNGAVALDEGAVLFKNNIKKNFAGIKNIELFIDGNYISY